MPEKFLSDAKLYVSPGISLKIALGPVPNDKTKLRTFKVTGPPMACGTVEREAGGNEDLMTGSIAPLQQLGLPPEAKAAAGIPTEATHFAFMYPLKCFAENLAQAISDNTVFNHDWLDALLFGAYVYFDAERSVVNISAFSVKPQKFWLFLAGPLDCDAAAFNALDEADRLQPVFAPPLAEAGLTKMAWVAPNETPKGECLSLRGDWTAGAFVYERTMDGIKQKVYFPIVASQPEKPNKLMGGAMNVIKDIVQEAEEQQKALTADLDGAQSAGALWAMIQSARLVVYYVLGVLLYAHLEGWIWFDTIYYLTTTATTVGYGDMCPETHYGRLFTIAWAPIGCVYVLAALEPLIGRALTAIKEASDPILWWLEDVANGRISASTFQYLNLLMGPVIIMLSLILVALFLLNPAEGEIFHHGDVVDAVYFAIITMTTIGYGDIYPSTWHGKLACIILMPIATSALANTIAAAGTIATRDAITNDKYQLKLKTMLLNEANGEPEVRLNRANFTLSVLKAHNLVDEETLEVIDSEFEKLFKDHRRRGKTEGEELVIDTQLLFEHLIRQKRIVHKDENHDGSASTGDEGEYSSVAVDMSRADQGFGEWFEDHWSPAVAQRAAERASKRKPKTKKISAKMTALLKRPGEYAMRRRQAMEMIAAVIRRRKGRVKEEEEAVIYEFEELPDLSQFEKEQSHKWNPHEPLKRPDRHKIYPKPSPFPKRREPEQGYIPLRDRVKSENKNGKGGKEDDGLNLAYKPGDMANKPPPLEMVTVAGASADNPALRVTLPLSARNSGPALSARRAASQAHEAAEAARANFLGLQTPGSARNNGSFSARGSGGQQSARARGVHQLADRRSPGNHAGNNSGNGTAPRPQSQQEAAGAPATPPPAPPTGGQEESSS